MKRGKDYIGVGAGAFILNEPRTHLLLVKRKRPPEAGLWSIPGGAVEFGETFEKALVREIKEEAGIDIEVVRLLRVTDHIIPEEGVHWVTPAFEARIIRGEPRNIEPEKHDGVAWFPVNDLPKEITMTTSLAVESFLKEKQRS